MVIREGQHVLLPRPSADSDRLVPRCPRLSRPPASIRPKGVLPQIPPEHRADENTVNPHRTNDLPRPRVILIGAPADKDVERPCCRACSRPNARVEEGKRLIEALGCRLGAEVGYESLEHRRGERR